MVLFNWTEKFELGIKEIDQQHKKIVDLINQLHEAREADNSDESLGKVINSLIFYTKTHLSYEENLLKQHEYPDFSSHKAEHDQLVRQAIDFQKKFITGNIWLSTDIAILLNDWLADHILVVDKKFVPFLESKGVTCTDRMENLKELLTGIEEIDNQHIQVYDLFHLILKAKEKNNEEEIMGNVIKLLEIWETHFKFEEDLMDQYKYSGFDEHKKEHDKIQESVLNLEKMYFKGFKYVINTLSVNLNQWMEEHIQHITSEDKKLGEYLNSKGVA